MGVFFSAWYLVRCFALGCQEMWRALHGRSWPTVDAMIEGVALDDHRCERLQYSYAVEGESYTGHLIRPTIFGVQRLEDRFWPETVVAVHVNPADPAQSYVPAGSGWAAAIAAGVPGLAACGLAVWIAMQVWQYYGPALTRP
jgi:hypothetical protein